MELGLSDNESVDPSVADAASFAHNQTVPSIKAGLILERNFVPPLPLFYCDQQHLHHHHHCSSPQSGHTLLIRSIPLT